MSVLPVGFGSAVNGGYQIERSLRFNSADSAYLNRTPASAGNRQKWTFNCWFKLSALNQDNAIFSAGNTTYYTTIRIDSNNELVFYIDDSAAYSLYTTQLFRDVSAWYNLTIAFDTTQATASNRVKIYINGSQITAFRSSSYPVQNYSGQINNNVAHAIGRREASASQYFSGYQTETYFIDGQALTPSDFGETDSNTGVWKPKAFSGTYGTNGFYLKFADNSGTTSTTLGKDSSGNGNNWTPNNFSVTAGVGNDSMVDSPTSYGTDTGVGGEVRGNYCTWNPLHNKSVTLTNGNLDGSTSSGMVVGTIAVSSGKWYWECTPTDTTVQQLFGIIAVRNTSLPNYPGGSSDSYGYYATNGNKYNNSSSSSYGASYGNGDVIGVALDLDAGTLVFYKNGSSQGTAYSSLSGTFAPASGDGATNAWTANFGQRPFAYTAPSGFKALCTQNLPPVDIGETSTTQANDYFDITLWTGDGGSSRTITNSGNFQPDLIWVKDRVTAQNHAITDRVRGAGYLLFSDATNANYTPTTYGQVTAFNSNGFTASKGSDPNFSYFNKLSNTYVGWQWKANGAGSSNTNGSVTSTVSVNTTSKFSIVTFTDPNNASNYTVGHGLGAIPSMIIHKETGTTGNWIVWHSAVMSATNQYLLLNSTAGTATLTDIWGAAVPTANVFGLKSGTSVSGGDTVVAYCFAPVAGYSAFGSYTGNGSSDGPFVYLGFRPRYVLWKISSGSTGDWYIVDSARDTYNVASKTLWPDVSNAEGSGANLIDFVSNGFKVRNANGSNNGSGYTFIYAAFAENPFKYSLAR